MKKISNIINRYENEHKGGGYFSGIFTINFAFINDILNEIINCIGPSNRRILIVVEPEVALLENKFCCTYTDSIYSKNCKMYSIDTKNGSVTFIGNCSSLENKPDYVVFNRKLFEDADIFEIAKTFASGHSIIAFTNLTKEQVLEKCDVDLKQIIEHISFYDVR